MSGIRIYFNEDDSAIIVNQGSKEYMVVYGKQGHMYQIPRDWIQTTREVQDLVDDGYRKVPVSGVSEIVESPPELNF